MEIELNEIDIDNAPPEKKAKKDRRRSTFGNGRISLGTPPGPPAVVSGLNSIGQTTTPGVLVDKENKLKALRSYYDNVLVDKENKLKALRSYYDKLTVERESWQRLVPFFKKQADSAQEHAATVSQPLSHSFDSCGCLPVLSDALQTTVRTKPDYNAVCTQLHQLVETSVLVDETLAECVCRSLQHKNTMNAVAKQAIRQHYEQCWQNLDENYLTWFE